MQDSRKGGENWCLGLDKSVRLVVCRPGFDSLAESWLKKSCLTFSIKKG